MFLKISIVLAVIIQSFCSSPWIGESKDENWMKHHKALLNQTEQHKNDIQIVFLGDSITAQWLAQGNETWNQYYKPRHAYNYGIGGDRTENVIYRIENGEFNGLKPKVLILMIGTNNIRNDLKLNTAADIAKGINEIKRQLEAKLPTTKILILGILPKTTKPGTTSIEIQEINKIISAFADNKRVYFFDMASHFQSTPGVEIPELYRAANDTTHLSPKGFQMWHQVMEPTLKSLLGESL